MKTVKKTITFLILAVFAIASVFVVSAYNLNSQKADYSEEKHDLINLAFEENNYDLWYETMSADSLNKKILTKVNSDNFETFSNLRKAKLNGNEQLVDELKKELGFGGKHQKKGQNKNHLKENSKGNCQH